MARVSGGNRRGLDTGHKNGAQTGWSPTFGLDLYIAISTGLVSLFTGMLEYQKLEATIVALNAASVNLHHLLLWWDSLTFVEKRMGKHRDNLVATTESAIMGK